MLIVYFSSATENTRRFVEKVGLPAARIPLRRADPELTVTEPYVLICPTYGGGVSIARSQEQTRPVPKQVIKFLNNEHNRSLLRGVIAAGNSNFGPDYGTAGDVISAKCGVPYLDCFELMGSEADVERVREQLLAQASRLGLEPAGQGIVDKLRAHSAAKRRESADRLAALRARYGAQSTTTA
ncbi:Putative NrdI-like protein [Corynebacterium capitovis DSM 44611]|uniref:class Ib ribonucleoside-diphosphate reductase assembly flavoprotein NrdI n=1 Tax=Corynebacterium capitovis TaxID=131081 RepID=UPI0003727DC9|nr:class Ib ribonucleoside-diphosphate reductase assembly flavoprotein NrdI [Corynebacterium capitovis]WKD57106.1 Putative NrdI-like protein [Corynebacterium capitovis DSM 44611]